MSKRYKGGRRQILQLEDKKTSRGENEPSSSAPVQKAAVPLDSQVADFFKEIDALRVNEEATESGSGTAPRVVIPGICDDDDEEESSALENVAKPEEKLEGNVQKSLHKGTSCPWQEICDESSGYSYYWNMETNDVTWECPVEYAEYLNAVGSSNVNNLTSASGKKSFKATKKKKKSNDHTVGAIIPITYFGGSSSDESSDESCNEEPSSTYKKSALKSQLPSANLKQEINALSSSGEVIGPQLPPNFQFPTNLKNAPKSSDESLQNEVDEFLEIGPKLLSNYNRPSFAHGGEKSDSTVSASSSISQSHINGTSFASSSHDGDFESLISDHKKSYKDSYKIGEESPDSTVKKGDSVVDPSVTEGSKAVLTYGYKPVVEYDSFTDDDDQDSPNISSSKDCTFGDSKSTSQKSENLCSYEKPSRPNINEKLPRTTNKPTDIKNENEIQEKLLASTNAVMSDNNITSSEEGSSTKNRNGHKLVSISSKMAATLSEFEKEIDEIGKALGTNSEPKGEDFAFVTSQIPAVKDVVKFANITTEKKENDKQLKIDGASKLPETSESSGENIMVFYYNC
ncbi:formin-binding protein 4-like [Uloborus diversus]|uniref:formin-binding protein 4-like n=1 Tax=Uloborus diversus TaxID=327109 RepID=UPI002409302D|nr:formin-binding protein 4-like [Uloborus diversus]